MFQRLSRGLAQARNQDFTLGGGTEAARVHFFIKKVDDFFSRRLQNLSSGEAHKTLIVHNRPYVPTKAAFSVKPLTRQLGSHGPPVSLGYAPGVTKRRGSGSGKIWDAAGKLRNTDAEWD